VSTHIPRPVRALVAGLAIIAVSLAVAAPSASANQPIGGSSAACHYDGFSYYACLNQLEYAGYLYYNVSAYWHVNMSQQYAQDIINCPGGGEFTAALYGNDDGPGPDSSDDYIRGMSVAPGWPRADSTGLEVHFAVPNIYYTALNEDDGADELFVQMSYWDCNGQAWHSRYTDNLVGEMG
jgi:hypothetical protein